jgi:predicted transcriptional regulator
MPQPSRPKRTKRQLDYDPSELEDLIHTPAVGSGVSSHLLTSSISKQARDETTEDITQATTVVILPETPQQSDDVATGAMSEHSADSTDYRNKAIDPKLTTKVNLALESELTTTPNLTPVRWTTLWMTEKGDPVPPKKVRHVRQAQDALSASEERVYDVLWAAAPALEPLTASRCVQAGYEFLTKKTRFSRKTIQRIIDRLIEKEFIEIEIPADIYTRAATVYRVFGYQAVLDRLTRRQRLQIAKIGPGVVFVQAMKQDMTTGVMLI